MRMRGLRPGRLCYAVEDGAPIAPCSFPPGVASNSRDLSNAACGLAIFPSHNTTTVRQHNAFCTLRLIGGAITGYAIPWVVCLLDPWATGSLRQVSDVTCAEEAGIPGADLVLDKDGLVWLHIRVSEAAPADHLSPWQDISRQEDMGTGPHGMAHPEAQALRAAYCV
jgi:hypothetical protein